MKIVRILIAFLFIATSTPNLVLAQGWDDDSHTLTLTVNEIANTVIRPVANNAVLTLSASEEGGSAYVANVDSSTWLNYTCVKTPAGSNYRVYAQITSGTLPGGVNLQLTTLACATGSGALGSSTGVINLSGSTQDVVTGIGSSQTARGANFGHRLKYQLVLTNTAALDFDESVTLTLTYTIAN